MPNPDYDPSVYTDTPVETQQNNDSHNISVSTPAPTGSYNNISNNNTPINVNESSSRIGQTPSKISSVLHLNYFSNKARRRFFWYVSESDKNKFSSYKEFKKHWNTDTKVYAEIKKDISADIDKLKLNKKTLSWFLNIRKRSSYR